MQINFFNYPFVFSQYEQELKDIFNDVVSRGAFILQRDKSIFEKNLASFTGARYALGVANGTDALLLALRAADVGPGDEVIFCSHTYVATAASIHFVGATPVPVECSADHTIDPSSVEAAITSNTKAIMPTQLNGRCCQMAILDSLARKHGLLVIEDAAQGLGAKFRKRCAGTFGAAGTISFYPAKNLGSLGDAGAILTNDEAMYNQCSLLHDHGRNSEGEVVQWGLNSRLDNLQAAILDFKLSKYETEIQRRRTIAGLYNNYLSDVDEIDLPPAPDADPTYYDVYQNYEIEAERRNDLGRFLKSKGIGTTIQWGGKAVHQHPGLGFDSVRLPNVERMFTRCLLLPMNTSLSDDEVAYVAEHIRSFYK